MIPYSRNTNGDRIEHVGDITLNLDYWDCECRHDYIHRIEQLICNVCDETQEESASSRENEVQEYVNNA